MFLRRNRPRDHFSKRPEKEQKRQTKRRKPNKCLVAALDADVMRKEYFVDATQEEAAEVTRILESKNYFEVLELNHKDDLDEKEDELRQSYLRKVLLLNSHISSHPRMTEAFTKLSQAYDVLSDPILRIEHKYNSYGGRPEAADPLGALLQSMFEDDMDMMPNMGRLMPPMEGRGRRPQRDPMFEFMNAFLGGLEAPGRRRPQRQRRAIAQPQAQPVRRGSNDSEDSHLDDIARDFARIMFGPIPAVDPAERRRREREEQRRLRIEHQRRRAEQERQQQEAAEEPEENNELNLGNLLQVMFGGAPRQQRQQARQRQTVTVLAPGNVRFVHRTTNGEQPPVVRARPVEAPAPSRREQRRAEINRQETLNLEQGLETLMGMGFSQEDSLRALEYANGKVDDAITLLLN